jgi:hypothetical protein
MRFGWRFAFLVVVLLFIAYLAYKQPWKPAASVEVCDGDTHEHADFLLYLGGTQFDFAQARYMDNETARAHIHDMVGTVVHKHWKGATWGEFFAGMGMKINGTCLVLDNATSYCNDAASGKMLKMFVNGTKVEGDYAAREIMDLDRVLFTYGNESEAVVAGQIGSVGDNACRYSDRCPERGLLGEGNVCKV